MMLKQISSTNEEESPHGVVANLIDSEIIVSEFEL